MSISLRFPTELCCTYRLRVPGDVGQLFTDGGDEVEEEDDQHYERTDESPRGLPEEVGLVTDHERDIIVESAPNQHTHINRSVSPYVLSAVNLSHKYSYMCVCVCICLSIYLYVYPAAQKQS